MMVRLPVLTRLPLFVAMVVNINIASALEPLLSPANVTDSYGNWADNNSTMHWASIGGVGSGGQDNETTLHAVVEYDPGVLDYYAIMVDDFLDLVFSKDPPKIEELMSNPTGTATYFLGFGICIAVGLLFLLIMPFCCCCFCCCRCCCGNCGGRHRWKREWDDDETCWARSWMVIVAILTILLCAGNAMTYASTTEFGATLRNLGPDIDDSVSNFNTFLTNTIDDVKQVTKNNYGFVNATLNRNLDNIDLLLGIPLRTRVGQSSGATAATAGLNSFGIKLRKVAQLLYDIDDGSTALKASATVLKSDLATSRSNIATAKTTPGCSLCSTIDQSTLRTLMNPAFLPNIATQVALMDVASPSTFTSNMNKGKAEFDNIPSRTKKDTASNVEDMRTQINSFDDTIDSFVGDINSFPEDASGGLEDVSDYVAYISPTEEDTSSSIEYWMFGYLFAAFGMLVVLLLVASLLCGVCGRKSGIPSNRSDVSNCAGNTLIGAVCCSFLLTWFFMLFVLFTFLIFGLLYGVVCDPLLDPEMTVIKETFDQPGGALGDGYMFGGLLLGDDSIPLTISGVLIGCRENGPLYDVMMMDAIFDTDSVLDYKSSVDLDSQISSITIDLSDVKLISAVTIDQMRTFVKATDINYNGFVTVLSQDTMATDITAFIEELRTVATHSSTSAAAEAALLTEANNLDTIESGSYKTTNDLQTQLLSDVQEMETSSSGVGVLAEQLIADTLAAEVLIVTGSQADVQAESRAFGNKLYYVLDQYVDKIQLALHNETGHCRAVWDVWNTVMLDGICHRVVGNINGIWFAVGWCAFIMVVCIVPAVKLSKYLHKMRDPNESEPPSDEPLKQRNKVAPAPNNQEYAMHPIPGTLAPAPARKEIYDV